MKPTRHHRKVRGFTLIEMMMVVAIIGILSALAIPRYLDFTFRTKQAEAYTMASMLKTAQYAFHAEHDCYQTTNANPPGLPSSQKRPWLEAATPGFIPCVTTPATFYDIGVTPANGNLYYSYQCAALPVAFPNPAEFACSITGDIDDDLAQYELLFCTDYVGVGVGAVPSPATGAPCAVTFEWVRVSAGLY